jgi:5-methylcytosine-specific restriction endonuclease McrA
MARQNHKKFMRRYRWQSGACLDCGKLYSETDLTRHHLVPKAKGGTDGGENIVLLCVPCHDARHTANAHALAEERSDDSQQRVVGHSDGGKA